MLKPAWSLEMCKLPESSCLACADQPWRGEGAEEVYRAFSSSLFGIPCDQIECCMINWSSSCLRDTSFISIFSCLLSLVKTRGQKRLRNLISSTTWSIFLFLSGVFFKKKLLFFWELPKIPPPPPLHAIWATFSILKSVPQFSNAQKIGYFFGSLPLSNYI